MIVTRIWGEIPNAKAVIIGSDPLHQMVADEMSNTSFYADVYYRGEPSLPSEKLKYEYGKRAYEYARSLLGEGSTDGDFVFLDLHPIDPDPYPPEGDIPVLTETGIFMGVSELRRVLQEGPNVKFIFAMGAQANRWLQEFEFYWVDGIYFQNTQPNIEGVLSRRPFFRETVPNNFDSIVGKSYSLITHPEKTIVPIHHLNDLEKKLKDPKWVEVYKNIPDLITNKKKREYFILSKFSLDT